MTDEEFEGLAKLLDATVRIKKFKDLGDYGYQVVVNDRLEDGFGYPTHEEAFNAAKNAFEKFIR